MKINPCGTIFLTSSEEYSIHFFLVSLSGPLQEAAWSKLGLIGSCQPLVVHVQCFLRQDELPAAAFWDVAGGRAAFSFNCLWR